MCVLPSVKVVRTRLGSNNFGCEEGGKRGGRLAGYMFCGGTVLV